MISASWSPSRRSSTIRKVRSRSPVATQRLGRYLLTHPLATGGMAEVWVAQQEGPVGISRQVVIKRILSQYAESAGFVEMFLNEARLAIQLSHPNLVHVYEFGHEGDSYFLAMEYVHGRNLRLVQRCAKQRGQRLGPALMATIGSWVCEGLHYAHSRTRPDGTPLHIVHRDISPENILVTFDGNVKVVDFGIAKATISPNMTTPGALKGKQGYVAPEQMLAIADRRVDIYSLGAVLYELLAGVPLLGGRSPLALLLQDGSGEPHPLRKLRPDLPAGFASAIMRALAVDPGERYQDARTFGRELSAYTEGVGPAEVGDWMSGLFGVPVQGLPAGLSEPLRSKASTVLARQGRRSWRPVLLAGLGTAAAALLVLTLSPRGWFDGRVASPLLFAAVPRAVAPAVPAPGVVPAATPTAEGPKPASSPPSPAPRPPLPVVQAKGYLVVRAFPWGDVTLDGIPVGMTPLAPLQVSAGEHRVTVINSDLGETRTLLVKVAPGDRTVVRVNMSGP